MRRSLLLLCLALAACSPRDKLERLERDMVRLGYQKTSGLEKWEASEKLFRDAESELPGLADSNLAALLEALVRNLPAARDQGTFKGEGSLYDAALLEVVRRGGVQWAKKLGELLKRVKADQDGDLENLELLTALRRVEGKPDPLEVLLPGLAGDEVIFPDLPQIEVALTNVDVGGAPVGFTSGGDYRTGRQARWRFEVRDKEGNLIPTDDPYAERIRLGGGLVGSGVMRPGEFWDTTLDMREFITMLEPGEYKVRVQYHDRMCIDSHRDVSRLMVCQSRAFALRVQPRTIRLREQDRQAARALLQELPAASRPKLLNGAYEGKLALKFIDPASPTGRLLLLGWNALPVLLDELAGPALSPERRASLLALLSSITGIHYAGEEELGDHEFLRGAWQVEGRWMGKVGSAGIGWSLPLLVEGQIDPTKQLALSERWLGWRKHFPVEEP